MLDAARRTAHPRTPRAAAVSALAAAAAAACVPFVDRPLTADEGGFLMVAHQWGPGTSLYGDYWVDRPPLLIGLFQLADLAGGTVALRLLGMAAIVASVLLAGWLGRLLAPERRAAPVAAAATAAVFLATPFFGTTEVNGELLGLPFVLGGLVALARGRWACAGALAMAAGAVKQSELDVVVAAGVAIALLARRRDWRTAGRAAASFAAGAVVVLGAVLGWAALHGTYPGELWDATVAFRGEADEVISSSASPATAARAHTLWRAFLASGAAAVVLASLPGLLPTRQPRLAAATLDVRPVAAALVVWEAFVVVGGGSYWLHYLVATVPALVLLVVAMVRYRPGLWRWTGGVLAYAGVTAVAGVVATAVLGSGARDDAAVDRYLLDHESPGDTAVVAFGDPAILRATGLSSPYPLVWSLPVRVRDPALTGLAAVLDGPDRPTWVLVDGDLLATWGVDDSIAEPVLDRRYELRQAVGDWQVYHVRED